MAPTYTTQNDYDYLLNAQDWRERIRVRLQMLFRAFKPVGDGITYDDPRAYENFIESILSGLDELSNDFQNTYKKKAVRSNLVGRGALYTYLIDKDLPQDLNSEHKKEIEAVFFASYIRLLLLEYYEQNPESVHQYKQERDDFRMRLKAEYTNVVVEISDAIEFIYLYRFERAIRKLYEITHKIEIKLSLKVGNLLEGCADNKRYIIGGRSAKDTMRRLNLIEHLIIEYLPEDTIARKRKEKKSNSSLNIEPNTLDFTGELSSYLAGGGTMPHEEVLPGKRKFASSDNLEYLESALAGSNNGTGSSGGGGMLFDVGNFFLEVENNPNSFFRNFELLEHNWKLLLELGYGKELDDLYQPPPQLTRKQRQSSATKLKFLQPKLTTSSDLGVYKNKKEYVLDHDGVPSHRAIVGTSGENRKNVPSAYEYAKNLVLGSFHLLKIFPMETKLPKYYEDQIKNESVILSLLQDESRHSNIIRLLDWNFPRISSIPSSVMLSLASLPSSSSSFISNKNSLHTPATFMNMMKKKSLLEEEKNEDKMNYFIFEFMDDFFPDFYQMHILSSAPVSPNGDGRLLVGGEDGRVLTIIRDMLAAVKSLHDRHMIHRDLSMDKFMVKCCGGDRIVAKLVNLSSVVVLPQSSDYDYYVKNVSSCLSHVEEGSKYPYHQFPTNVDYAAPELHHLKASSSSSVELFTPAMDCWPLGVIFKYLCTGSLSHISSTEWKGKSQEEWTAANETALYHLPKNLSSTIQGLLQLSPQTRSSLANAEKILFDM